MRLLTLLLSVWALASPISSETLIAARTIRAQAILTAADLAYIDKTIPGMLTAVEEAVGQEARVVLYAGRPIRPQDIGPPAIVERNQIVTIYFRSGALTIAAEARALTRAGVGDMVRLMNLASRNTVTGIVREDGSITVGGPVLTN